MNNEEEQESQELIPIEQQTITFHGLPLIVVRLPDGRPGVVLRWICENLHLAPAPQVARIKRTEVIADDLVYVRIETDGGPQIMPTLILHAVPYWLATIDTRRMEKDDQKRLEILRYQREVVDVLYAWAQTPRATAEPKNLVPSEPITRPTRPAQDAPLEEWHQYHLRMASVLEWQMEVENWRGSVENRLEGIEAIIPDILDRLGPQTITPEHQRTLQVYIKQLHEASKKAYPTIYEELKTAFAVSRYQDIPEEDWEKVVQWFQVQINRARKR